MSTTTLQFAPSRAKAQLAPANYETLTAAVSRYLSHAVSRPDGQLDVAWARAFVRAYAQDAARHTLQVLDDNVKSNEVSPLSNQELSIRSLTLRLARRLANAPDALDVSTLVDVTIAYGTENHTLIQALYDETFKSTPKLLEEFKTEVLPAFVAALQSPERRSIHALSQILHGSTHVALVFAEDQEFVVGLAKSYQVELDKVAASRGGISPEVPNKMDPWQKDWLHTKSGLLDAFHAVVQALLQSSLHKHTDRLLDLLFAILDLPSSSATPRTPFISQPLLADYQYAFDLSSMLNEKFRGSDDARIDLLTATLRDLSPAPRGPKPAGVLSAILTSKAPPHKVIPVPAPAVIDSKGKAKAVDQEPEYQGELDLAVSQVLDIFFDETPQHIQRCLKHHAFNGDPEKLISALLEGTLPAGLVDDHPVQEVAQIEEFEFIKDRRNIWDDDAMDFSRLRIGKMRGDADAVLQNRSFTEQMKADIIRRAEELSDDEEDAVDGTRGRLVPFDDELNDGVESLVDKGVKIAGDGEESDETDDEGHVGEPAPTSPETILELAYIDDPKLFDRDAATRRSKSRSDLKAKTGWGDEQIEGWRIMLERNPKKDKILGKHEFAGNAILVPNANALEPGPSGSSRGGHSQRGRGGNERGRGRGGGRGGGGDTARGRAWKDTNKARQGNHNRKRGHDKKMARGGGGAPV